MYFDRFDIVEAYYLFFVDYHEGQASEKYERLCKIQGYYSRVERYESLTENGREIYDRLSTAEETIYD